MQWGPTPGWYADPWRAASLRWWDGGQWTGATYQGEYEQKYAYAVDTLPQARSDIRGGGIAILGFLGANALSLCFALAAAIFGIPLRSVGAELFGLVGLWTGFAMTACVITHRRAHGSLTDLGLAWPSGGEIGRGIGMGVVAIFVAGFVAATVRSILPEEAHNVHSNLFSTNTPGPAALFLLAIATCIGAPIFEELFFRGIVQGILARNFGMRAAIPAQALMFGMVHYQLGMTADEAWIRITSIAAVGLLLGTLRARTGRLGAGMVTHATYNLIVLIITFAALAATT